MYKIIVRKITRDNSSNFILAFSKLLSSLVDPLFVCAINSCKINMYLGILLSIVKNIKNFDNGKLLNIYLMHWIC